MKNFCLALVMLAVVPAVALAGGGGGGGSKPTSFIKVTNDTPWKMGVIVQPGGVPYSIVKTPEGIKKFEADGGKYVESRKTIQFTVKEGQQTVSGANVDAVDAGNFITFTIASNATVIVIGNNNGPNVADGVNFKKK